MSDWLRDLSGERPFWLNAMFAFCAFMTFFYVPWDLVVKPAANDQEVWFGMMFTGAWAKLMALPHWFVYGAATYGFYRRRPWMLFWGPLYITQVAIGMFVWCVLAIGGGLGFVAGIVSAVPFAVLAIFMRDAREHFMEVRAPLPERYGEWALITGASAGIGRAFARALAAEGVSCVLTARREDRLIELANELERAHGVATRTVAIDLAEPDGPDRLANACRDLEIGLLVNNAGLGYAGRFDLQEGDRLRSLVAVNCMAPVLLSHHFVPAMRERGRGAVIFTGSVAGRQPLPLHAAYSASKSFDLLFGESLYVELRDAGVDVLVLEPGSTETEFQQAAGELAHAGEAPDDVVAVALGALGNQPAVISGWLNWLRANLAMRLAPRTLVAYIGRDYMQAQTPADMQ